MNASIPIFKENVTEGRTLENPPLIERAYQLARSGLYPTVTDVRKQLRVEGYVLVENCL